MKLWLFMKQNWRVFMNIYNKLLNNLEQLKLLKIKEYLDNYINLINDKKMNIVQALFELTEEEIKLKEEKAIHGCVKVANFPFFKTFEEYDFSFQPSINKEQVMELASLRFIEEKKNILLIGSPGTRKNSYCNCYWYRSC